MSISRCFVNSISPEGWVMGYKGKGGCTYGVFFLFLFLFDFCVLR